MFAFLCGITCCTGDTISCKYFNKLSAWFSCSNSFFYLANPAETWMKIHFKFWSKEFCSGKARSQIAKCWWAGTKVFEEHAGRKLTQLFAILRTWCCPAYIIHVPSKGEMRGKCFPLCYFTKHMEKSQSLVQPKTWAWQYGSHVSTHIPCLAVAATGISMQQSWGVFVPQARLTELILI